jgi:hypothetical protein
MASSGRKRKDGESMYSMEDGKREGRGGGYTCMMVCESTLCKHLLLLIYYNNNTTTTNNNNNNNNNTK